MKKRSQNKGFYLGKWGIGHRTLSSQPFKFNLYRSGFDAAPNIDRYPSPIPEPLPTPEDFWDHPDDFGQDYDDEDE